MAKTWNQMSDDERGAFIREQELIRSAVERARDLLPPAAMDYAPEHPDSIATFQRYDEFMAESEFEVALSAVAEIARGVGASDECWAAIDRAAHVMGISPSRYRP